MNRTASNTTLRSIALPLTAAAVAALCSACGLSALSSATDDPEYIAQCGAARDACNDFVANYCATMYRCDVIDFDDFDACIEDLTAAGWDCPYAAETEGDMAACTETIATMDCETAAAPTAFEGTACEESTVLFADAECPAEQPSLIPDDDASSSLCECSVLYYRERCSAKSACFWSSSDPSNPYSSDGYCSGTYSC